MKKQSTGINVFMQYKISIMEIETQLKMCIFIEHTRKKYKILKPK